MMPSYHQMCGWLVLTAVMPTSTMFYKGLLVLVILEDWSWFWLRSLSSFCLHCNYEGGQRRFLIESLTLIEIDFFR